MRSIILPAAALFTAIGISVAACASDSTAESPKAAPARASVVVEPPGVLITGIGLVGLIGLAFRRQLLRARELA